MSLLDPAETRRLCDALATIASYSNPAANGDGPQVSARLAHVEIDSQLVPLLSALRAHGIEPVQSCEERRPGLAWIAFDSPYDALAFLRAAGISEEAYRDPLAVRACDSLVLCPDASPPDPWGWAWSVLPRPDRNTFDIAVEIPCGDLPEVARRLCAAVD